MKVDLGNLGFEIDNSLRNKYSRSKQIFLDKSVAEALVKAKEMLPKELNFKIKDGLRTLAEQEMIVKQTEKAFKKSHPKKWEKLLKIYTGGYEELKLKKISYMNHRSGKAVDLTISKKGKELNLGGVRLDKRDGINYYKEGRIAENRKLLKKVLSKTGFKVYKKEWWHWGFKG